MKLTKFVPRRLADTRASQDAGKIRDIRREPPRSGWTRRGFVRAVAAAGAIPFLTQEPAAARAQRTAGRIRITDLKIRRLRLEKDWGSYEDYVGGRRGGRTGLRRGASTSSSRRSTHRASPCSRRWRSSPNRWRS